MRESKATAKAVVRDLRSEAEDQPDTRRGARWAQELYRAASTVELAWKIKDDE